MVAGDDYYRLAADLRDGLSQDAGQLDRERFQTSQAPGRLGEHALSRLAAATAPASNGPMDEIVWSTRDEIDTDRLPHRN